MYSHPHQIKQSPQRRHNRILRQRDRNAESPELGEHVVHGAVVRRN
jgi:hypothetical protein